MAELSEIQAEKLLPLLESTDNLIRLRHEQVKLMNELRWTIAREAVKRGLLPRHVKQGEPCPVCTKKRLPNWRDQGTCENCRHSFGHPPVAA